MDEPVTFSLSIQLLWWVESATVATLNGDTKTVETLDDYYALGRTWADSDAVDLSFEVPDPRQALLLLRGRIPSRPGDVPFVPEGHVD